VTTEEGDVAGVGAGRVPAGDTELRGRASAVGFGVVAGLVRVVGFGVAAGGDVVAAGNAGAVVVAGVTAPVVGGLTSR
jgi:hypothetical protein